MSAPPSNKREDRIRNVGHLLGKIDKLTSLHVELANAMESDPTLKELFPDSLSTLIGMTESKQLTTVANMIEKRATSKTDYWLRPKKHKK